MTIFVLSLSDNLMEKFARGFFSMRMMALAMFIFFVAIATATLVESTYDIQTAKIYIYNAIWFDLLLVYLGFNLIANIFRYKMFRREKLAALTFHLAFIIIMIGAAVTRFVSFEGSMLIREGASTSFIYSSDPYLWYKITDRKLQLTNDHKMLLSEVDAWNGFSYDISYPEHKTGITLDYVDFQKKMIDSMMTNPKTKESTVEFVREGKSEYVPEGGFLLWGNLAVSYEKQNAMPGIEIFRDKGKLTMKVMMAGGTSLPMSVLRVSDRENPNIPDSLYRKIPVDTLIVLEKATLYAVAGVQFVYKDLKQHTKIVKMPSGRRDQGVDILTLKVTDGTTSKVVSLEGGFAVRPEPYFFELNGLEYEMTYGPKKIDLPFAIRCDDFQLDRYPGSMSPSSFASVVTVLDTVKNYEHTQRIFMNNVMDYSGYRFFQSSYDADEKGTILSVNHDWWGTWISYWGYIFMGLGMVLTLLVKNGRFRELNQKLKKSKQRRTDLLGAIALFILLSPSAFSQEEHHEHDGHNHGAEVHSEHDGHDHGAEVVAVEPEGSTQTQQPARRNTEEPTLKVMSVEHSDKFATLLVQDNRGRIIPMHTLCDQFLRKIRRSQSYDDLNAVQTIISMHMYPQYWVNQPLIHVSMKGGLREKLGMKIGESYISYWDLSDSITQNFKLLDDYEKSHRKEERFRDEYDKQLLKLGERYQIVGGIFVWQFMKVLPLKEDKNNTWYVPLNAEFTQYDSIMSRKVLKYFTSVNEASNSGTFSEADKLLDGIIDYQYSEAGPVAPSREKIKMEISYNKMNIFSNAAMLYLSLGFILLIVFFVQVFILPTHKSEKRFKIVIRIFGAILFATFLYHGAGVLMRSYITGYAPWSNGYEAVIFIGLMTMFFAFIFSRKNPVLLAGGAILAFLMLFVTEMNLMDPEITPMQPVLKSYWLMIHVAIITGSYAPLGLSCILGFLTLILYIFRNKQNSERVMTHITELTAISEMVMTIGLFMLTIGTFLGGIWANESWGRYWGWDPKETWALVAVLVYAVILHLRYLPALKGKFTFSVVGLWGYASILFTFFGVNFYLVGLHSYAQGEGLGTIPMALIFFVLIMYLFTEIAWLCKKLFGAAQMIPFKTFRTKLIIYAIVILFLSLWTKMFGLSDWGPITELASMIFVIIAIVNLSLFGISRLVISSRIKSNVTLDDEL
ncbi:MAG: cytochrome c-type biogenesis protein CcsB [Crocinitomicaceae bacterium]|jgi:cytochrome c-type biogenesis protein CcsB